MPNTHAARTSKQVHKPDTSFERPGRSNVVVLSKDYQCHYYHHSPLPKALVQLANDAPIANAIPRDQRIHLPSEMYLSCHERMGLVKTRKTVPTK